MITVFMRVSSMITLCLLKRQLIRTRLTINILKVFLLGAYLFLRSLQLRNKKIEFFSVVPTLLV